MDTGERIILEYAWQRIIAKQHLEREKLARIHESQREEYYRAHKEHCDTYHDWKRTQPKEPVTVGPKEEQI